MSDTPVLGPYGHYEGCPSLGGLGCNCAERDVLVPVRAIYDASTDPVPRLERHSPAEAAIYGLFPGLAQRECDCGSSTPHDLLPGVCTAPASEPALDPSRIRAAGRADLGLHPVPTIAEEQRKAWVTPIAGTPSTMLGEALVHLQRARDLLTAAGVEPMGMLMYDLNGVVQRVESRRDAFAKARADAREAQR